MSSQELQPLVHCLKSSKSANSSISARTRGGLVAPCEALLGILEEAEISSENTLGPAILLTP